MKKCILILLGLLLLLTGCANRPAADAKAAPQPTVTVKEAPAWTTVPTDIPLVVHPTPAASPEAPEREPILGHCISIVDELPYAVDLDGDGVWERVDLIAQPGADDSLRWTLSVQKGEEVKLFQTDILNDMPFDLWVGDLDEDGQYEIFCHGDLASDDYLIYAFRSDMTLLFFEPDDRFARWNEETGESSVFAGAIAGFEDGHIIVEGVVDMLGTHWGIRTLAIGDDGVIGPVSTVWAFDEADRPLIVKKALTAYQAKIRKDPGEAFTLQPGEKIVATASDGYSRLWFETEQGKSGVLLLTPDEDCMWRIEGEPEADFFESLPYSG